MSDFFSTLPVSQPSYDTVDRFVVRTHDRLEVGRGDDLRLPDVRRLVAGRGHGEVGGRVEPDRVHGAAVAEVLEQAGSGRGPPEARRVV